MDKMLFYSTIGLISFPLGTIASILSVLTTFHIWQFPIAAALFWSLLLVATVRVEKLGGFKRKP